MPFSSAYTSTGSVGVVASTAKLPSLPGLGARTDRRPVEIVVGPLFDPSAGTRATFCVRSSWSRNERLWPSAAQATLDTARSRVGIRTDGDVAGPAEAGGFAGITTSLFMS